MARKKPTTVLTRRELAVMKIVWEASPEPLTIREVTERLNAKEKKPFAYTTIQTMMSILKDKGVLKTKAGKSRAHSYEARVSQDEVRISMVTDLVDRLFDGQAETLLAGLVEQKSLQKEDLKDLKKLIEAQLKDEEEEK